jgi:alkylation response protein AidB-like acyl-CoA dehydrogenase
LAIKNAVKEFCEKEFKPEVALELDKKEEYPIELYKKAAKLGFTSSFSHKNMADKDAVCWKHA